MVVYEKLESLNQHESKTLSHYGKVVYYVDENININGKICVSECGSKIILLPNSFIFFNKPSSLVGLGKKDDNRPTLFLEGQQKLGTHLPNIIGNEAHAGIELNINMCFQNLNLDFYKLGGNNFTNSDGIINMLPALRVITRYRETLKDTKLKLNDITMNQCNNGFETIILNNYSRENIVTECYVENFIYNSNRINQALYCSQIISINDQKLETPVGLIIDNATITNGYIECLWINAYINNLTVLNETPNPLLQKAIFNFDVLGRLTINLSLSISSVISLFNFNVSITLNQYIYNQITDNGNYFLGTNNIVFNKGSKIKYLAIRQDSNIAFKTVFIDADETQVQRATRTINSSVNVSQNNIIESNTQFLVLELTKKCEECINDNKGKNLCEVCANQSTTVEPQKRCLVNNLYTIQTFNFFGQNVTYNFTGCPNTPP